VSEIFLIQSRTERDLIKMYFGKAVPLQARRGPEGSRKLRFLGPKEFQEVKVPTFRDNGTGWW
jgi:hypothetical protein